MNHTPQTPYYQLKLDIIRIVFELCPLAQHEPTTQLPPKTKHFRFADYRVNKDKYDVVLWGVGEI